MSKIAIFYCKRIQDHTCIACAKCFKGIKHKHGEFAHHDDEIEIVSLTDCGDCPGLIVPRTAMIMDMLDGMDQKPDAIHLGTCIKMACETAECPMDLDDVKIMLEAKTGLPVYIGTHAYV